MFFKRKGLWKRGARVPARRCSGPSLEGQQEAPQGCRDGQTGPHLHLQPHLGPAPGDGPVMVTTSLEEVRTWRRLLFPGLLSYCCLTSSGFSVWRMLARNGLGLPNGSWVLREKIIPKPQKNSIQGAQWRNLFTGECVRRYLEWSVSSETAAKWTSCMGK